MGLGRVTQHDTCTEVCVTKMAILEMRNVPLNNSVRAYAWSLSSSQVSFKSCRQKAERLTNMFPLVPTALSLATFKRLIFFINLPTILEEELQPIAIDTITARSSTTQHESFWEAKVSADWHKLVNILTQLTSLTGDAHRFASCSRSACAS